MDIYISILIGIGVAVLLTILFQVICTGKKKRVIEDAKIEAQKIVEEGSKKAKRLTDDSRQEIDIAKKAAVLEAKDEWLSKKRSQENEIKERKREIKLLEKKLNDRLTAFDKRYDELAAKENRLNASENRFKAKEKELDNQKQRLNEIIDRQKDKLSEIAGMSKTQAIDVLKRELIDEAKQYGAKDVKHCLEQLKIDANKCAADILSTTIQRISLDYVTESTVSVVSIPNDEMKGRIIGREGRNIRTFEKASGVDLIIDDTPEAVVLSCFDPVRREIARITLEKLISDGRIHPGRIEDLLEKTSKEMEKNLIEIGEKACLDLNIKNVSSNIIKLIGRLNYRTSYGQNVLQHSKECAWICGIIAAELGLNQEIARRAGFLHDIGKAVDHEFDGSHANLGATVARKNGEKRVIVNAIEAHHEEAAAESAYAPIAQAADTISGARPGARRDVLESYMKRLDKLEEIANSLDGVHKSYAIQAGRELRIIVDPMSIDDSRSVYIASDIVKRIEKEMQYPGQIKVTVIRETRHHEVAK